MSEPEVTDGPRSDEQPDTGWDREANANPALLEDPLSAGQSQSRWLTAKSATLAAILVGVIGFYAGIREEKSSTTGSSSSTVSPTAAGSSKFIGAPTGSARGFGPPGGNSANLPTTGTVQSVNGNTIYVKDSSGNTIKVKLLTTTTLSKSEKVTSNSVHPGDSVTLQGPKSSGGTLTATSLSDAGATSTSTSSSTDTPRTVG